MANIDQGVYAHQTDNNNFAAATIDENLMVRMQVVVAGATTVLGEAYVAGASGQTFKIALRIYASGLWQISVNDAVVISGTSTILATGGALASGKSGLIDWRRGAEANTRTYSNFTVTIPPASAIAAPAGQDMELREDVFVRESAAGDYYSTPGGATVSNPPLAVPKGSEGVTNRALIIASRFNPSLVSDPYADSFTVEALHTPVYALSRSES